MRHGLWRDRRGASAITFGILSVPVLLGVGLSLDYVSMSRDRAVVQGIADRALLSSAVVATGTESEIRDAITGYINQVKATKVFGGIDAVTVTFPTEDRIKLRIDASTPTTIMNMVSDRFSFSVTAEAMRGLSGELEVVMALDTTTSMELGTPQRLTSAKDAAKELLDKLSSGDLGAKVRFSLVPFGQYVKVYNKDDVTADTAPSWLEFPASESKTVDDYQNCANGTYTVDGVEKTGKVNCTGVPKVTVTHSFQGCVGSRPGSLALEAGGDASSKIPGLISVSCSRKILPLTDTYSTVKSEINALTTSGETHLPSGLLWAFNMLTPSAPLSTAGAFDPDDLNLRPHKAIVLMTDGENTRSVNGKLHSGTDKAAANAATKTLCDNVKAKKIAVYTVAFQVTDATTKTLLEDCATEVSYYFAAEDAAGLIDAFKQIAKSLKKVRLAG